MLRIDSIPCFALITYRRQAADYISEFELELVFLEIHPCAQLLMCHSRISGVIPALEGCIPSDEMIECNYENARNARRHYYGKENDREIHICPA